MQRITAGVEQGRAGDRGGARAVLDEVWHELGDHGDPLHVVTLAHFMADLQDDPLAELEWDRRALAAADGLTDERVLEHGSMVAVRGFYPSLYASLAADYAKLDDIDAARSYLTQAEAVCPELPDGEYGNFVRDEIARLRAKIGVPTTDVD